MFKRMSFRNGTSLITIKRREEVSQENKGEFACKKCDFVAKSKAGLKMHELKKHNK